MIPVVNSAPNQVLSFVRKNDRDKVFTVINFSDKPQTITFQDGPHFGHYTEYLSGRVVDLNGSSSLELKPWASMIFVQ